MPIRSPYLIQKKQANKPVSEGIGEILVLITELKNLKTSIETSDKKSVELIAKLEQKAKDIENKVTEVLQKQKEEFNQTIKKVLQIQKGDKGDDPNYDYIINKVLAQIEVPKPKEIDENKLIQRVIKQLPERKADLKIVKEEAVIDPMVIIDKIMELPEDKREKLISKNKMLDGMQQTIRAMQSQLARGYLHGGGVPSLTEGTGVTLVKKDDGGYVISATGGSSSIYTETPTGDIDGTNVTYTVLHNISKVITFAINGMYIHRGEYTVSGNTITFNSPLDASFQAQSLI
jgi:hypothetical protein